MCGTQINTRTCLSQSRGCPCSYVLNLDYVYKFLAALPLNQLHVRQQIVNTLELHVALGMLVPLSMVRLSVFQKMDNKK